MLRSWVKAWRDTIQSLHDLTSPFVADLWKVTTSFPPSVIQVSEAEVHYTGKDIFRVQMSVNQGQRPTVSVQVRDKGKRQLINVGQNSNTGGPNGRLQRRKEERKEEGSWSGGPAWVIEHQQGKGPWDGRQEAGGHRILNFGPLGRNHHEDTHFDELSKE